MINRVSYRSSNRSVLSACLLAATILLASAFQARAQSSAGIKSDQRSASPEGVVTLGHHTPGKVVDGTAIRLGHYDTQQKLRLAIFVTPPDLAGEEKLIREQQTKGSPNFHKFLTAGEWNERFGPKVEDEQKVVDWVKGQGLTVTNRYANRMIVDVEAPAGVIEQALSVTINHYQVGEEVDFSNDRDPSIPAHLSGIVGGIFGLNSIRRMRPANALAQNRKGPDYLPGPVHAEGVTSKGDGDPAKAPWNQSSQTVFGRSGAASGKAVAIPPGGQGTPNPPDELGGLSPSNLYSSQSYDYNALYAQSKCCNVHNDSNGSPADTSIALVTFGGFNQSDANVFFGYYGLAWNVTPFLIDGSSGIPGSECKIGVDAGCNQDGMDDEADLDVEYSTAFSNSFGSSNDTAHVYVYETANGDEDTFFDTWNSVLNDGNAHVVSTSYGLAEEYWDGLWPGFVQGTDVGDAHYIFNALTAQGVTLVAAAGDQGSTEGCSDAVQVIWPADDPNFVAAGGTSLTLNYDGTWNNEAAWTGGTTLKECQSNGGGGGSGVSIYFPEPSWQADYSGITTSGRMIPDISLEAGGPGFQWDYCTTAGCQNDGVDGWATWGGTSIVAPELAGFFAQENSYLNSIGHICGSDGTTRCEPIGNPAPILYYEGAGQAAPHYPFYDITQGCVTNYLTATYGLTYYCAGTGYDEATGWGSANMLQLAWAFNFYLIPSDGVPSVSFSGPATNTWYNSNQTVSWTVSDGVTSGTAGLPAPGVAGFTQGWDSIPADVYSEPHGGAGNSFYSGPQYPYGTAGCLSFVAGGCSGGVSQGCHNANVEAWDNQGFYTGAVTYGPLCYDTVAPVISVSNNPATPASGWWNSSVTVTLTPSDPGGSNASGIYRTYYAIDSTSCYPGSVGPCSIYTAPFKITAAGQHYIYYWTQDKAGNVSVETYEWVSIDLVPPTTTASLSGTLSGGTYYSPVTVTLSATDTGGSGVAHTYYQVDGGATTTYAGPFTVSTIGSNSVKYWSVDGAGNVETAHTITFNIAAAPATITSPVNGSTLPAGSVTFKWNAGNGVSHYELWLGTSGVGSSNLYNSGSITATSAAATIPAAGVKVYAQLNSEIGGVWKSEDYTYTESGTPAILTSPKAGSTFTGTSEKFTWSAGLGVTNYQLWLGTSGVGSSNLYNSGSITALTTTASSIPADGKTVYARLSSEIAGAWKYNDYTFTEEGTPAVLTAPKVGSTLGATNVTFTWNTGEGVTNYQLWLGTSAAGSSNVYDSGSITATSVVVPKILGDGVTLYARLSSETGGVWSHNDYTFVEPGTPATLYSPAPGSTLGTANVKFEWTAGVANTSYQLWLGTSGVGSSNLYNSGSITAITATVATIPATGVTVYGRLYSLSGGVWSYHDYTYIEK